MQPIQATKRSRHLRKFNARRVAALAAAAWCGADLQRATADTWTWTGSGGNVFWTTPSNWNHTSGSSGSSIPTNSTETVVDFAGSTDTSPFQNISAPEGLNSIGFNSGAAGFTLGGNALEFFATSLNVNPTIVQSTANTQQIAETIIIDTPVNFTGSGSGTVDLEDSIVGGGNIVSSASYPVGLLASNNYSGGTTLSGSGQIIVNNNNSLGSGTLSFNGGTLTSTANITINNPLTTNDAAPMTFLAAGGTTLNFNPSSALFGSMNFGAPGAAGTINFEPASFSWFGGTINVNGGTLADPADALAQTLSAYTLNIAHGATFNIDGFNTTINNLTGGGTFATGGSSSQTVTLNAVNFTGAITGSGKLITPTTGTALLTGSSSYSGGTTAGGGTLGVSSTGLGTGTVSITGNTNLYAGGGAAATMANAISINSGTILTVQDDPNGNHSLVLNGNVSGAGALVMNGTGKLALNGANSYSGGTTLNSGEIDVGNATGLGATLTTVALNAGSLVGTSNVSLNYNVDDSAATTPITISAATGTTLGLGGNLNLGGQTINFGSAANAGTINFTPGVVTGTFQNVDVNGGNLVDGDGQLSILLSGDSLAIASGAAVNLNGGSPEIANLTGAGSLVLGSTPGGTLTLDAATFSGSISGSGLLATKSGSNVVLSGNNSYSAGTTLAGGTVGLGSNSALGSNTVTVTAGTSIFAAAADHTLTNAISINSGQILTVQDDPNGAHNLALIGNITGSGAIVMDGTGSLVLSGSNNFTGGTSITSGQVVINTNNALGTGLLTFDGGALVGNANLTIRNIFHHVSGITEIFEAAPGTTFNVSSSSSSYGNLAFGSSTNTGTVSFKATGSSFGGTITVNGGTLLDGAGVVSSILAADTLSIAQSATVNLNGSNATIKGLTGAGTLALGTKTASLVTLNSANFSGNITGSGNLAAGATATNSVILSGSNSYAGTTTLGGAAVGFGNDLALSSGAITVTGSTRLYAAGADHTLGSPIAINSGQNLSVIDDPNGAHNLTLNGNISGSGALVMSGTGQLVVNGTNSYAGGTTLNSGEIDISNGSALGATASALLLNGGALVATSSLSTSYTINDNAATSPITIAAATGTTLSLLGTNISLGTETVNFGSSTNAGTIIFAPAHFGAAFQQVNVNGGTLTDGAGILNQILNGDSLSIAQGATLNAGNFAVSNLTGGGTLAMGTSSTGTLTLNAATFSGSITGSGAVQTGSSGTVILSGTSTYTGGTIFAGGTVGFGSHLALSTGPITVTGNTSIYAQGSTQRNLANSISINAGQNLTVVDDPNNLLLQTFQFAGPISGSGGLVMSGSGVMSLQSVNTYTGGTTVNSGTATFSSPGAFPQNSSLVNNSVVNFRGGTSSSPYSVGHITGTGSVTDSGFVRLTAGSGADTQSLISINTGDTLDITNNKLVLNYGSAANDPVSAISSELSTGRNNGAWTGTGIQSSSAAANFSKFAVGFLDGNSTTDLVTGHVAANQLIVAYTILGDAFLENSVGFDDLLVVAQNYGKTGEDWAGGNFNYDPSGSVGFADLLSVAQNYGVSSGVNEGASGGFSRAWQNASTSVVPEPGFMGLIAASGLLARRRRTR